MIATLDTAAQPQGNVEVFKLTPSMSNEKFGEAVRSLLGQQADRSRGRKDRTPPPQPTQPANGE